MLVDVPALLHYAGFTDLMAASRYTAPIVRTGEFAADGQVDVTRYIVTVPKLFTTGPCSSSTSRPKRPWAA